jgi:hypothetical protein
MMYGFVFVFAFMGGFAYGSLNHYVEYMVECTTYRQGNTVWVGYRAISNDYDRRCFWLEDKFPSRVRQGVEVNGKDYAIRP